MNCKICGCNDRWMDGGTCYECYEMIEALCTPLTTHCLGCYAELGSHDDIMCVKCADCVEALFVEENETDEILKGYDTDNESDSYDEVVFLGKRKAESCLKSVNRKIKRPIVFVDLSVE